MSIASLWFLALVGVVAVAYHLCTWVKLRQALLSAVNLGFLYTWVPNRSSWGWFVLVILGSYLLIRLAKAKPSGWFVFFAIAVSLAGFVVVKHYTFVKWILPDNLWNHPVELVGISYMLFKFIHVFIDAWQGQLSTLTFITYANYQLAFFTLIAGPIQRYNDFQRFWSEMGMCHDDSRAALVSWNRIFTGLIKIGPVAAGAWYVFQQANDRFEPLRTEHPCLWFLVYMYAYPVFLYFNFSGYTDVMIGAARLLGFQLPENFNRPYLARNVIDYWNRWHITLSQWIRDYVFMTSYKAVAERFPAYAKYLAWALLFFALFIVGVWHGSTGGFAVFGALNGLGAAVNEMYGDFLKTWLGRRGFQQYLKNRLIRVVAIALTVNFQCFGALFFSSGVYKAFDLIGIAGNAISWRSLQNVSLTSPSFKVLLICIPVLGLLSAGFFWKGKALVDLQAFMRARLTKSVSYLPAVVFGKAALVTVIILFTWAIVERDPVVVYMRF